MTVKPKLRFQPVSFSWVALHPQPKGVIQFIGGAFFGTFAPMFFYRHLLEYLFKQGYTIIILPFNFTFDHYTEAGFLIKEQYTLMPELVRMAQRVDYEYEIYEDDSNFSWIGHSVGCKLIALLEAFSALSEKPQEEIKNFIRKVVKKTSGKLSPEKQENKIQSVFNDIQYLIKELEYKSSIAKELVSYYVNQDDDRIDKDFDESDVKIASLFIKNQPSLLLAPVNTGLGSAIKPKFLADFIISLGFDVKPTRDETFAIMEYSSIPLETINFYNFNYLGLVHFKFDRIAKSTLEWFFNIFKRPSDDFRGELKGGHLKPLGYRLGNLVIKFPEIRDIFPIQSTKSRNAEFEEPVNQIFEKLVKK